MFIILARKADCLWYRIYSEERAYRVQVRGMGQVELQFEILEDIARGVPVKKVLEKLVGLVESEMPGAACSVHLLDEDGLELKLALAPSLSESYNQDLARLRIGPRVGSCGAAAFFGKPVLVADAMVDEQWADYRELARRHNVKACWSTPILSRRPQPADGARLVLGTFAVYPEACGLPDEEFLQLMQRAQHLACIALETDRTNALLKRQRELLLKAQAIARLGCFEWNLSTNKLTWSDTLYQIFGVEQETFEPSFESFLSLVHPEDREQLQKEVQEALATRSSFRNQERIVRPNGSIRILESFGQVECDDQGAPVRLIGACYDITDRKRMEKHLAESQKMEAVGRLAGGLAHDFNNLLTVINGHVSLLEGAEFRSQEDRESLAEISEAGKRAAELTTQLLAFSRSVPEEAAVIDFNQVVRNSLRWIQRLVGERVEVLLELAPEDFRVEIDPSQLDRVIMNLVLNARDAMSEGGVLRVSTRARVIAEESILSPGSYVELCIQDSGTGIPQEVLPNIFEPFFTTKERERGTGLGLAVVHGVVSRWSGHVDVASGVGEGTSFRIALPLSNEPLSQRAKASEHPADKGSGTILLVEDEKSVRRLVAKVLKAQGYEVLQADNGQAATQLAEKCRYDFLLTDIVMPGMGGRELADQLRRKRPELPVLFMSGYSGEATDLNVPGVGPVSFLKKPFSSRELPLRVRELMG